MKKIKPSYLPIKFPFFQTVLIIVMLDIYTAPLFVWCVAGLSLLTWWLGVVSIWRKERFIIFARLEKEPEKYRSYVNESSVKKNDN